jgi:amino-acid N-acetyltransferase
MASPKLALRAVDDDDAMAYVETLLARNGLPSADVRENPAWFFVATAHGDRVGVGGIERHGRHGLLRSLAVETDARGEGYGTAICDALEARARDDGLETLTLLTTTASAFFAARGYDVVDRETAPDRIRDTTEFSDLCPANATCMQKSLEVD